MKKALKIILAVLSIAFVFLVAVLIVDMLKEDRLQEEKFKTLSTETVEIDSFDEYKEIPIGWWGFEFPSKQVKFTSTNTSYNPCWALGNNTDFLYTSTVRRSLLGGVYNPLGLGATYDDIIYAKTDFAFPQIEADSVSAITLSNKAFYYLQSYDAENKQFVWNEGTLISCDFDKNEIKEFCGFLEEKNHIKANNDSGNWYIPDSPESGYILCHDQKPYGFIIRLYFNDNLYYQEYMLCKTDKGKYLVIRGKSWSTDYHTNYVYLLSDDFNERIEQMLLNVDFCNETQDTLDECKKEKYIGYPATYWK